VTWYGRVDARITVAFALITAAAFTLTAVLAEKLGVTDASPAAGLGPFPPPPAIAVPANTPTTSARATPAAGKSLLVRMMSSPEVCDHMTRLRIETSHG
jgi:hypothetical protein